MAVVLLSGFGLLPRLVGIERRHRFGQLRRLGPKILLIDDTGVVHHERHNA